MATTIDWFDELALDPETHPVSMGTRSLGDRPWLVADDERGFYLDRKRELLRSHRDRVLFETPQSANAAHELARLVGAQPTGSGDVERAALHVQEDLLLLQRKPDGWFLDASCLCFPTRWHLSEKVGQHIAVVHGPVDGYDQRITTKVDRLFDQVTDRPVWRRNWFLMTDTTLYQPDRPASETLVPAAAALTNMFIRSERQTLRQVTNGWIVFTVRIQQAPLGALLTSDDRVQVFRNWVHNVSSDFGARRHLTPAQRTQLLAAL